MELNGREVGFRRSILATTKIAEACPNHDISKLGDALGGDIVTGMETAIAFVCALSEAWELHRKREEPGYIPNPVTREELLDETEEALHLLTYKGAPPLSCASGIVHAVERSYKGAVLTSKELLSIASLLRTAIAVKQYGAGKELKALEVYFGELVEQRPLADEIERIIIAEDMVADDASDDLYRIRRAIRRAENEVREVLNRIITGPAQKHLQEAIVTQRSGRFVVPVKASEKSAIKGIVHDSSASGATLFIEPAGVVEANNKLRDLMGQEKEEIEKIMDNVAAEQVSGMPSMTQLEKELEGGDA